MPTFITRIETSTQQKVRLRKCHLRCPFGLCITLGSQVWRTGINANYTRVYARTGIVDQLRNFDFYSRYIRKEKEKNSFTHIDTDIDMGRSLPIPR